jgi:hypothetical protein
MNRYKLRILLESLLCAGLFAYGLISLVPAYLSFPWCDGRYRDEATHSVICAPPGLDFYWRLAAEQPAAATGLGLAVSLALAAVWRAFCSARMTSPDCSRRSAPVFIPSIPIPNVQNPID